MFTKKTYRKSRWIEYILDTVGVLVEDEAVFDIGWYRVNERYKVEVYYGSRETSKWFTVKFMRLKGTETFGVVTTFGNWIDLLSCHYADRVRITLIK